MIKKYKYNIEEFKLITCMADFFKGVEGLSYDMNRLHASPLDVYMSESNCYKLLLYMKNRVDRYRDIARLRAKTVEVFITR